MSEHWDAPEGPPPAPGQGPPPGSEPPGHGPPPSAVPFEPVAPQVGWEPPPAVYQQYAPATSPTGATPDALRVLTIVVSVIKALPLALFAVVLIVVAVSDDLNEFLDLSGATAEAVAVFAILAFFLLIGGLLLFVQVRGVIRDRLLSVVVVASILVAIDLLLLVATALDGDAEPIAVAIFALTLAAQAAILGWTLQVRSRAGQG